MIVVNIKLVKIYQIIRTRYNAVLTEDSNLNVNLCNESDKDLSCTRLFPLPMSMQSVLMDLYMVT